MRPTLPRTSHIRRRWMLYKARLVANVESMCLGMYTFVWHI